jgi:hypothetical protein
MKKIITSNLYNNIELPKGFRKKWENHYKNAAKKMGADFYNYSISPEKQSITRVWQDLLNSDQVKINQCSMFDEIDKRFKEGYDFVMNIDSDLILNPENQSFFDLIEEDFTYFGTTYTEGVDQPKEITWKNPKAQAFLNSMPEEIFYKNMFKSKSLEKYTFRYAKAGIVCFSKKTWAKIRPLLLDPDSVLSHIKEENHKEFFNMSDQAILSVLLTVNNINIKTCPQRDNTFLHLLGASIDIYQKFYKFKFPQQKKKKLHGTHSFWFKFYLKLDGMLINVPKKMYHWLPIIDHYTSLPKNEQVKFWPIKRNKK